MTEALTFKRLQIVMMRISILTEEQGRPQTTV